MLKNGGVGIKVKESKTAPDSDTIFRIGSVSKVFAVSFKIQVELVQSHNLTNSVFVSRF